MKLIFRSFILYTFSLWVSSYILPFFEAGGNLETLLFSGFLLTILMLLVKPVLKILFIPINIMTFGLLSWLVNVAVIYLLALVDTTLVISPWTFPGVSFAGIIIPSLQFTYFISLTISTFVLTVIFDILHHLTD